MCVVLLVARQQFHLYNSGTFFLKLEPFHSFWKDKFWQEAG